MRLVRYTSKAILTCVNQIILTRSHWNLSKRTDRAITWVKNNSIEEEGVKVTSRINKSYPEVSGYLIPTLINWGERDLALKYASYLIGIQNPDGGFPTPQSRNSAFFDTGQILRGLFAISAITPDYRLQIERALQFMVSSISESGELILSEEVDWAGEVPRAISLYAIAPCISWLRNNDPQSATLDKFLLAVKQLIGDPEITELKSVNHFHAYIMDALIDLGYEDLARNGMKRLRKIDMEGAIAGNSTEKWICTTGQFQYSIIFTKLGMHKEALESFLVGAKKQNRSGGWYGSVGRAAAVRNCLYPLAPKYKMYFPNDEIPWANKYYLDALSSIMQHNFDRNSDTFKNEIDLDDNRYRETRNFIQNLPAGSIVLDAGCGKGRYLLPLSKEFPSIRFTAMDISAKVMESVPGNFTKITSPITNINAPDKTFDAVIIIEALEHAAYINGALKELSRVVNSEGSILIIDKRKIITRTVLEPWETWFSLKRLRKLTEKNSFKIQEVSYLGNIDNTKNLFFSLKATK